MTLHAPHAGERSTTPPFDAPLLETLFAAILIDDEIDPVIHLPDRLRLDYPDDTLRRCFALCRALWHSDYDRRELLDLVATLRRDLDLGEADRLRFKHIRAKFKHFRYAFRLYDRRSRDPWLFDRVTIAMGHLQDAYRNRRVGAVRGQARLLRLLLSGPFGRRLEREALRFEPVTGAAFRRMLEDDRDRLRQLLARDRVTGAQLHAARKIVGRQVSFYDTLRTLEPDDDAYRMSRALSAINGLIGALHDDLVVARSLDPSSYHDRPFPLPQAIRERLAAIVAL